MIIKGLEDVEIERGKAELFLRTVLKVFEKVLEVHEEVLNVPEAVPKDLE